MVARWYHCISRCVRRAFLLDEGPHDRKGWIENRLEELAQIFAIAVGGFSVMDDHLHVRFGSTQRSPMVGRTRRSCDVGDGCFHRAIKPGRRWLLPMIGFNGGSRTRSG